jgi:hypothetical protein
MVPRGPAAAVELSELSARTLIVIEDDDDVVDMLATLLARYGAHLVRVRTVADAANYDEVNHVVERQAPGRHLYLKAAGQPRRWWQRTTPRSSS